MFLSESLLSRLKDETPPVNPPVIPNPAEVGEMLYGMFPSKLILFASLPPKMLGFAGMAIGWVAGAWLGIEVVGLLVAIFVD